MPAMVPRSVQLDTSFDSDAESEAEDHRQALGFLVSSEDPRTISQIKRSRIDLEKRYVFLCPMALSKHFEALPHQAKDSALLVFRCQRNMLFPDPPSVRRGRIEARVDCRRERATGYSQGGATSSTRGRLGSSHYKGEFSKDFLKWVSDKEKDGSVFWIKPEKDLEKLSMFFEEKCDPVSDMPYRPLLLDTQWWRVRFMRKSARFVTNPCHVIAAISAEPGQGEDMEIEVLQELIYQSNPNLEPVSKWPHAPSMRFLPRSTLGHGHTTTSYKGYIDQERALDGSLLPAVARESSRIGRWPVQPRDRLDNLHHLWQNEEALSSRRQAFTLHAMSTLGRPLTAR
mmetsp:Transcript_32602/g.65899  ORF Transcript_32602/g.65899 Transcript_32602/m.65899 type:complete len:342 (+) Transcript_32602:73-1098(+)